MLLHKSVSALFLSKTYELVNHPSTENVVSRSNGNHTTFVMWSPSKLVRYLLPNYFKHNFSSFIRQLNTYGFRKIVPEQWEFANKYFREGKKHQLCQIQRNKMLVNARTHIVGGSGIATSQLQSPTTADDHEWSPLSSLPWPLPAPMLALVLALSDNNERRRNWMLVSEVTHMQKLYNDLLWLVHMHVKLPLLTLPLHMAATASPGLLEVLGHGQVHDFMEISSSLSPGLCKFGRWCYGGSIVESVQQQFYYNRGREGPKRQQFPKIVWSVSLWLSRLERRRGKMCSHRGPVLSRRHLL